MSPEGANIFFNNNQVLENARSMLKHLMLLELHEAS
jgi:hypothetical protein